ncbi:Neuropeptide F receptor [Araneus ventricosus]|uniref:Neuropeptide F receptor n=1 Tax=Araneus ventricosus TaxID=182803 RepID=A0A4Y2S172_ARAVE|nr:Neuropeptide F receptor [Araneus ventricosus]GBN81862.1 Neuropeptide F receptor [Araneus ventricosus]
MAHIFQDQELVMPAMSSTSLGGLIFIDKNISILPRLNFSFDDAVKEIERHTSTDSMFDKVTETIIIFTYSLLIISGIISNFIVSGIIVTKTKICSTRYAYVINLSISDLILCVFCMPFSLIALIKRRWILGLTLCKLVPFVQAATVFLSSATVSAIAVDRHKNVLSTFPSGRRRQHKEVIITIIAVWTISFIISSPILYAQTVRNVGLPHIYVYEKCLEEWPWDNAKGLYTVIIVLVQFLIPTLVLIITHLRIEAHLNYASSRYNKSAKRPSEERVQKERQRNRRATFVLLMISAVFSITWLPWNIFNLIADFYPDCMTVESLYLGFVVCHIIAMTSTTTNPILYGWFNSNIRKEILSVRDKISNIISNRKDASACKRDVKDKACDTNL